MTSPVPNRVTPPTRDHLGEGVPTEAAIRSAASARRRSGPRPLYKDSAFVTRLRVRVDDALRDNADPAAACLRAIEEHEADRDPGLHHVLAHTAEFRVHEGPTNRYVIMLRQPDGRSGVVSLSQEEVARGPTKFIENYMREFHELLTITAEEWKLLVNAWLERAEITGQREDASPEQIAWEDVRDRIARASFTHSPVDSVDNETWILVDERSERFPEGAVLVAAKKLQRLLKETGSDVKFERFTEYLREQRLILDGKSVQVRIDDSRNLRHWAFAKATVHYSPDRLAARTDRREPVPPTPERDAAARATSGSRALPAASSGTDHASSGDGPAALSERPVDASEDSDTFL